MVLIGHRGAMGYAPENTLKSFKQALDLNVDMVELDVYRCKTGELVIIHDDRLERTTNGIGYVEDKTFIELRELDAGEGEKIPLLTEVLDFIDKKVPINIELKGINTAEGVADIIQEYIVKGWAYNDFLVSSFNHHELSHIKQLLPEIRIGALLIGLPITYAQFAQDLHAYSLNISIEFINQDFVNDAHTRGLKVYVFTVNHPEDMNRLRVLGVDGVFSNVPDKL
jgi:glycerophosphoryl diester phosphodiesterase